MGWVCLAGARGSSEDTAGACSLRAVLLSLGCLSVLLSPPRAVLTSSPTALLPWCLPSARTPWPSDGPKQTSRYPLTSSTADHQATAMRPRSCSCPSENLARPFPFPANHWVSDVTTGSWQLVRSHPFFQSSLAGTQQAVTQSEAHPHAQQGCGGQPLEEEGGEGRQVTALLPAVCVCSFSKGVLSSSSTPSVTARAGAQTFQVLS